MLWTMGSTSLMLRAHQSEWLQGDAGGSCACLVLCWWVGGSTFCMCGSPYWAHCEKDVN